MLIVTSKQTDIYRNLALEEWLLDHADQFGPILFLCVNEPCVVIGKNQNPWRECRLSLMEEERVPLARRVSGGGAVYHDSGNLNVGVIVPRTHYREEKQYELIFQALEKFDIQGERLGKNSLTVNRLKFSGQAFCFRKQHVLHHGTLLVSADLRRLGRYLGPDVEGIETKAVASVPARVANLSGFADGVTVESISSALADTFKEICGSDGSAVAKATADKVEYWNDVNISEEEIVPMIEKLSSGDWKLNHTPRFQVTLNGQVLQVEKGRITNLKSTPLFAEWLRARK